jgi:hypothetical protein
MPEDQRQAPPRASTDQPKQVHEPPRPSVGPGEPSAAEILSEAFEDLRRRMVTIEGRIVSISADRDAGERGDAAPEWEAPPPARGRDVPSALAMAVACALCFGAGVMAAERVPELAQMGRDVASWGATALRDGSATAETFLER